MPVEQQYIAYFKRSHAAIGSHPMSGTHCTSVRVLTGRPVAWTRGSGRLVGRMAKSQRNSTDRNNRHPVSR